MLPEYSQIAKHQQQRLTSYIDKTVAKLDKERVQAEKDAINKRRQKSVALGMGTSSQLDVGSSALKREGTLHSKGKPEQVVSISDKWKSKSPVKDSRFHSFNSHERLFVAASNVDRQKEDGCMNKLKIERSIKLRTEDFKNRGKYDIVSGVEQKDDAWINAFGG